MGLRYDYFDFSTTNKLNNDHRNVKDSSLSPNVGLVWQPVPEHSFYTSYSKSFAPFGGQMGVNQVTGSTDVTKMDKEPQYNEQYEVGVKSEWLDNRLNTQFSVFDIRKIIFAINQTQTVSQMYGQLRVSINLVVSNLALLGVYLIMSLFAVGMATQMQK